MIHGYIKMLEILPTNGMKDTPKTPIENLTPGHLLANKEHFRTLSSLIEVHCLRTVCKRKPELQKIDKHVPKHIKHKYSEDLRHATVTVSTDKS